ncbi:MAG: hypothetical protein APF77_20785 [Clostridia bacterium BRH_c25]|nr:MAG: hypothetical protein APF77_20785 [Clostridia bacterium BRH_c25]
MSLPSIFNSMGSMMKELQVNEILRTNEETKKYGLILTAEEAAELVEVRNQLLRSYGRVELDMEATRKLINSISDSPFINQEDYASVVKELQEVFYYLKNETDDEIGDDSLIEIIKDLLNDSCGGSIELLQGRELAAFVRDYRLKHLMNDYI